MPVDGTNTGGVGRRTRIGIRKRSEKTVFGLPLVALGGAAIGNTVCGGGAAGKHVVGAKELFQSAFKLVRSFLEK